MSSTMGDDLPVMLWRARPDMSCEFLSRRWLEFTGCSEEQALGEGWARGVHPEDLARWLDACVRAFDAREPFEIEYRLRRHDGEYRWVLERAAPRYARDGEFLGYAGACIDIDERKRAELELVRALERERRLRIATEDASRLKDGLLASVLRRPAPAAREANGSPEAPLLHGVRVLIVEADPRARDALAKVLAVAGAETRAASAEDAPDALGAWHPDVMLSDTGARRDQGDVLIRALAAGRDARLAKPVEPLALLAAVARALQEPGMPSNQPKET